MDREDFTMSVDSSLRSFAAGGSKDKEVVVKGSGVRRSFRREK